MFESSRNLTEKHRKIIIKITSKVGSEQSLLSGVNQPEKNMGPKFWPDPIYTRLKPQLESPNKNVQSTEVCSFTKFATNHIQKHTHAQDNHIVRIIPIILIIITIIIICKILFS